MKEFVFCFGYISNIVSHMSCATEQYITCRHFVESKSLEVYHV